MNSMRPRLNVDSNHLVLLSGSVLATIDWMRFKRETNQRRGIDRGIRFIETFSAWDIAPTMNVVVEFLNGESQKNFVKQLKYIFTTPVKSEVLEVNKRLSFFAKIKQLTGVDLYACKAVPGIVPEFQTNTTSHMPNGWRKNAPAQQNGGTSYQDSNTAWNENVASTPPSLKSSPAPPTKFMANACPAVYMLFRNTPLNWTNDELIDFAAEAGTVCFVDKFVEAIVKFSNSEAAQQAIQRLPMHAFHGKTLRVTEYKDENDANQSEDADLLCFDDIGKDATPLMPSPPPKSVSPNSESPFSVDSLREALPKLSRSVRIENIPSNCQMIDIRGLVESIGKVGKFTMKHYPVVGYIDTASKKKALEKLNGKLKAGKIIALEEFNPIDAEKVTEAALIDI
ncbi:hypothetical protein DdX_15878 [Ditylenchus destructor]|uniref:RRM domain-containing protein n=1 Tax=Ditylenchus destructor TaxID=166010 RepID=A0AAD4MPH9_9BILA|nr:hypothetical protein DdX_15878 [Ditylenchus destructor]